MSKVALILTAVLAVPPWAPPLAAWGELGHRLLAGAALEDLPPELAAWFAGLEDTVRDHANDPDRWKRHDPLERPRHCLYCEPYGGPDLVPRSEAEAQARLGPACFQQCGQAPWAVLERVRSLAGAFAAGDAGQAAFEAAILSHYAGDLHVPMHTTVNHNGARSGQLGVHHRWEIGLLDRCVQAGWQPEARPADLGLDPWAAPWSWLRTSFLRVPRLLADDLAATRAEAPLAGGEPGEDPGRDPGEAYWQAFLRLQGGAVREQLTLAGQDTARMILLAWTEAGQPATPPPPLPAPWPAPAGRRCAPAPRP